MKSITIHGINKDLDQKIAEKSAEYGLSQNRTLKMILQNALLPDKQTSRQEIFADLFGKWTSSETKEFESRVKDFEKIDKSDWVK